MINRVVLVGRLVRDPELRRSPSGVSVVNFTIAVDNRFAKQDSPNKTDFIPCVVFNKTAEIAAQYARKGTLVGVEGRISTRNYENNEGKKVYVTEVLALNVMYLDSKKDNKETQEDSTNEQQETTESVNDPFAEFGDSVSIDDNFLE